MTGLRFGTSDVLASRSREHSSRAFEEPRSSKCPRRTILNALERAKILMPDRDHGITPVGVNGESVLAAACRRTIAIAAHRAEGRFEETIRDAEAFLPPIVGPSRGKYDVLLLDVDAVLDADRLTLLRSAATMAVLREAYQATGKAMGAAHMSSYLRQVAHAIHLKALEA